MSVGIIELGGDYIGMGQFHKNMSEAFDVIDVEYKIYTSYKVKRKKDYSRINFIKFWTIKPKFLRYLFLFQAFFRLSLLVTFRRHKHYILHFFGESSYNTYFVMLFKFLSIKYVVFVHDLNSLKKNISNKKFILNDAKVLVGLNDVFVDDLKELFPAKTVLRVQHPRYNDVNVLKERIKEIRVLFWGHLKKSKGLDIFLAAIESMKSEERSKFKFSISGQNASYSNDELVQIVELCTQLNVSINLAFSSESDLKQMLNSTDVVVLPYKRVYQSGALLHSIAHRACVVASDIPFFSKELSHGHTGILFESENHIELKQSLISLDHFRIKKISEMAYDHYIAKYSVENLSNDLKNLLYAL